MISDTDISFCPLATKGSAEFGDKIVFDRLTKAEVVFFLYACFMSTGNEITRILLGKCALRVQRTAKVHGPYQLYSLSLAHLTRDQYHLSIFWTNFTVLNQRLEFEHSLGLKYFRDYPY